MPRRIRETRHTLEVDGLVECWGGGRGGGWGGLQETDCENADDDELLAAGELEWED